ncbi:putative non-specific serine/threonine protein kinase [Rosa chinensis]|uniref:Putative non-specific serine/threonine protein kinase n=1 Tax=Rosa chinensis TaxID=74649 RepID=A0A2P6Q380_ROSCH|nr:putative non-specific serine/threonine protein kinase [Rosa chinensis]
MESGTNLQMKKFQLIFFYSRESVKMTGLVVCPECQKIKRLLWKEGDADCSNIVCSSAIGTGHWLKRKTEEADELQETRRHPELQFCDLNTLKDATENFSPVNELDQGGFGSVYKLPDNKKIAVKRLSKNSGQGIEEFKNE